MHRRNAILQSHNLDDTFAVIMPDMGGSPRAWQGKTGVLNQEMPATSLKRAVQPIS